MFAEFVSIGWTGILVASIVTMVAAFVKGATGFAMPMIMVSGLASFLSVEQAIAALLIPTLVANIWQALRGGLSAAISALGEIWRYLAVVLVTILLTAQLVTVLPTALVLLLLGVPVTVFAAIMLIGWSPKVPPDRRPLTDVVVGLCAGFSGGLSGVWGPPTVLYLTAIEMPKVLAIRIQGVIYGFGAVVLLLAHIRSGLFNAETAPLSFQMVLPMIAGMWLGQLVQDRLDQALFRKATLVVLIVVGCNLIRRGLLGLL